MAIKSKSPVRRGEPAQNRLRRARSIAKRYQVILTTENGEFAGRGVEIPNARGRGHIAQECVRNTQKAMAAVVVGYLRKNRLPPISLSQTERTHKVKIRITGVEHMLLEARAHQDGYAGVEEYLRATALGLGFRC